MWKPSPWCGVLCSAALALVSACSSSSSSGPDAGSCLTGCGEGFGCVQNSDFPDGLCTAACAGGSCPSGTVCSPVLSSGSSYCLQSCASSGCPSGQACTNTSDGQVCLPPSPAVGSPISCAAPQLLAGPPSGPGTYPGCRTPVVSSALSAGAVQDLGTHSPGESVSFTMPSGAAGFSIVSQKVSGQNGFIDCQGEVLANVPVPSPIVSPSGATFFDYVANFPLDLTTSSLVFFSVGGQQPYTAALTFPNTTAGLNLALDGGVQGGVWTFDVNDYANEFGGPGGGCDAGTAFNTYDVQVVVTPGPAPTTAQLAVDVYLATSALDAGSAVNDAAVQQFASRYASFYANAGVCVTTMTFHDLPAWASRYDTIDVDDGVDQDPCSDFRQMFTLAQSGRSMALFFVDDLVSSGEPPGDEIVGKDGAVPGIATYNGTVAGGSVVLAADLESTTGCSSTYAPETCGPDLVATIAAHETGHFLGMFHPTEQTGDAFDPLTDTAACVCALCETDPGLKAACSNNPDGGEPTLVDNVVCSGSTQLCGGANLLMFWILTDAMRGDISPQEAEVMRSNPLLSAP